MIDGTSHQRRRPWRGDFVYWRVPPGPGAWPTEGFGPIVSVRGGVAELRDGTLVDVDEVEVLRPRGTNIRRHVARLYAPPLIPPQPVEGDDADYLNRYLAHRFDLPNVHPSVAAVMAADPLARPEHPSIFTEVA